MFSKSFLFILLITGVAVCSPTGHTDIEPLIVAGVDAQIAEFPFMVSLRVNGSHWCGGNILNDWWVLTVYLNKTLLPLYRNKSFNFFPHSDGPLFGSIPSQFLFDSVRQYSR